MELTGMKNECAECDSEHPNKVLEYLNSEMAGEESKEKRSEPTRKPKGGGGGGREVRVKGLKAAFDQLKEHHDSLSLKTLFEILAERGICPIEDPRLSSVRDKIRKIYSGRKLNDVILSYRYFENLFRGENEKFVERVLKERLVLDNVRGWVRRLTLYRSAVEKLTGSRLSISLSSADGQKFNFGKSDEFQLQEMSHVLNYAMALQEFGFERLHQDTVLENRPKDEWTPSNPLTGAGPLFIANKLIRSVLRNSSPLERRATAKDLVSRLAGGRCVRLDESSNVGTERRREYLKSILNWTNECDESDVEDTVQYYLETCSILVDTETLSDMGMTLANGGVNPRSGAAVLTEDCVEKLLGVMTVTGCKHGAPALASSSGGVLLILPGVLSLALHSTNRDASSLLLSTLFKNIASDPFRPSSHDVDNSPPHVSALFASAECGDTLTLAAIIESDQVALDSRDYMGRTALHMAAANDRGVYAEFLLGCRPDLITLVDKANRTPLQTARLLKRNRMAQTLENFETKDQIDNSN